MAKKRILVLGATGSIGKSTIQILRANPDLFSAAGFSAHRNVAQLLSLGTEFGVCSSLALSGGFDENIPYCGTDGLCELIRETDADIVVNGISGAAGLMPSVEVLSSGKDLALANKETMVMAGSLIKKLANSVGKKILPVDSEHSAIFYLLNHFQANNLPIKEILLTASGGPFRQWDSQSIINATVHDALQHPTWNMGQKITIDSASMANKGLEVIEAVKLFSVLPNKITVVVHPQSIVHSMIRMEDNVVYAQLSKPDMKHPIMSALTYPKVFGNDFEILAFDQLQTLTFEPPRVNDFKLLPLAYAAATADAQYPVAYNAANEIAVAHFLQGTITFGDLAHITEIVLQNDWSKEAGSFEEVLQTDILARKNAEKAVQKIKELV